MNTNLCQIALFGTSADPPTYGHQALLNGLINIFPMVVTWASDNPMKSHGASLEKRKKLLDCLVNEINHPKLQLVQEISSPWTIQTLNLANAKWPDSKFIFVIGSDLIEHVPNWSNIKFVLKKCLF